VGFSSQALAVDEKAFQRYSHYYDLLYRDKDYEAEVDYVARTLRSVAPNVRHLLEFGSGTGRHGRLLAALGFDIVGIERSETMVAEARRDAPTGSQLGGRFNCMHGDIRIVNLQSAFDAVISLLHVVSYQTCNLDLIATFTNAARHLNEGGIFFFDVWHGPAVLCERPSVRVKRVEDENTRLTRIAEPKLDVNAGVVTVSYTILAESKRDGSVTTFEEDHHMRYLFPSEIRFLAHQSGFSMLQTEEFLTGEPPSEKSWGVAYLLKKQR
jgi:SAM-dependent methyltransferase